MRFILKRKKETTAMSYCNITKEQWDNLLEHPPVREDKSLAPLAIWGRMTPTVELNEYGEPRCIGANVLDMYALQIDVDSGCSIDSFISDYHRYRFSLYTSYSYGYKQGERFRVIFPLKERLYTDWLVRPVKDYLVELFPMSDVTCFDRGHFQILPCVREKGAPYKYIRHDGELLSFAHQKFADMASEYSESAHWKREISEADRDPYAKHDAMIAKAQTAFDNATEGTRDKTVYGWLRWLKGKGCTYAEVSRLRPPSGFEEEFNNKLRRYDQL